MANRTYSSEFRSQAVELFSGGKRSLASVARELGVGVGTVQRWVVQAPETSGVPGPPQRPTTDLRPARSGRTLSQRLAQLEERLADVERACRCRHRAQEE